MITYASQEIRSALDYRAVRLAYGIAMTNSHKNPMYVYEFDAHWNSNMSLEGYIANSQTFVNAIDAIGDVMFDELDRFGSPMRNHREMTALITGRLRVVA